MTNEELKKKICDIIAPYVSAYGDDERIADALIMAGICDVSNIILSADNALLDIVIHKAEVRSMEKRVKDAEHRAARAERALEKFAENITCEDCPFFSDCASSEKMEDLIHSNYCFAEYLRQAEKELAEEGK